MPVPPNHASGAKTERATGRSGAQALGAGPAGPQLGTSPGKRQDAWADAAATNGHQQDLPSNRSDTLGSALDEDDDTVNVVVRVRPLSDSENQRGDKKAIQFPGDGALWIDTGFTTKSFTFNVTFEPEAKQNDVFEHSGVKKLIEMALNGYSCTTFAFGQTGSGKTHTMTGPPDSIQDGKLKFPPEQYGIIPRSFQYLFSAMKQRPKSGFRVSASFLEIYNEQVIDLLNPNARRSLQVRWNKNKGFYVENLFHVECESVDDLMAVLEEGMRNRVTGSNSVNEHSSRSHSMLTLSLDSDSQHPDDENLYITKRGKLTFVDLAGSEKTKAEHVKDAATLVESNNINRSLLVLGNCISALGDKSRRGGHIPYRDSKLTKLLADSLGGNGVTLMISCVSPSSFNAAESMNTLRYANRAKKIKTKPVVKMDPREKLIMSLKREVKVLRQENHYLRQQLEFPVKPRGQLQKENDEKFLQMLKSQKLPQGAAAAGGEGKEGGDSGLYEMLQEYMIENEGIRKENRELQQMKEQIRRDQEALSRQNEHLIRRLEASEQHASMGGTPMSIISLSSTIPDASPYQPGPSRAVNGLGGSPKHSGNKRPPHMLEPITKQSPGSQVTPRNGFGHGAPPHYNYTAPGQSPNVQRRAPPRGTGHQGPGPKAGSLRSSANSSLLNKGGSRRSSVGESAADMNERLRQELAQLDGEIRYESKLTTPQAKNSRWEVR